jgi:hypothetical protein
MFSIPPGAELRSHPVALRNSGGTSAIKSFEVTEPVKFGAPRIDHVMLVGSDFDNNNGQVTPILYVQGANIDVGAVVKVNDVETATAAHRALRNSLYGTDPDVLGYPVYHWVSLIAMPGAYQLGSKLRLSVQNLDDQISPVFEHTLPASEAELDSDGDNLLDTWEEFGFDADGDGNIDVALHEQPIGANPWRPDILVEVDVMENLSHQPLPSAPGDPGTFETAQAVFRSAPILNPGGQEGINLYLDVTMDAIDLILWLDLDPWDPWCYGGFDFYVIKEFEFDNDVRDKIFHYAIWGNMNSCGDSGWSDISYTKGSGDDFLISMDDWPDLATLKSQVETFVHELGHNLGQLHGGNNRDNRKSNYWSVMSYTWQFRSVDTDEQRFEEPTCAPIYWAEPTATEPNGQRPLSGDGIVDYSHGMAATIVEDCKCMNELTGLCGAPVDWTQDGDYDDMNLSVDANLNGDATGTSHDFANWPALDYRGPEVDGRWRSDDDPQ